MTVTVPRRAFLGAELPGDHEAFGDGGVRITGVAAEGMAARAGLAAGDVMITLADQPLRDLRELSAALRRAAEMAATDIVFVRDGSRRTARVDVVPYPREQAV